MEKFALTNTTEKLTQPEKNFVSDLKHLAGEARDFYDLEHLWADAQLTEIADLD